MIVCSDFPERDGLPSSSQCCRSCHEDAEMYWPDYALSQIYENEISENGDPFKVVAELCCNVLHCVKNLPDWQAIVRDKLEGTI